MWEELFLLGWWVDRSLGRCLYYCNWGILSGKELIIDKSYVKIVKHIQDNDIKNFTFSIYGECLERDSCFLLEQFLLNKYFGTEKCLNISATIILKKDICNDNAKIIVATNKDYTGILKKSNNIFGC